MISTSKNYREYYTWQIQVCLVESQELGDYHYFLIKYVAQRRQLIHEERRENVIGYMLKTYFSSLGKQKFFEL